MPCSEDEGAGSAMSSWHCRNLCQSTEPTHLQGLPLRVLNPSSWRTPEPSFSGRGGQPLRPAVPAISLAPLPAALVYRPKALGRSPLLWVTSRCPTDNSAAGNNSFLFHQDPVFPPFICSNVCAIHTCAHTHTHASTCIHTSFGQKLHTQTCTHTCVLMLPPLLAHVAHCSPIPPGCRISFCAH